MAEDIKGLIEKIRQEGIQAGQDKAREITDAAQAQAAAMIEKARSAADKLIAQAGERISGSEASSKALLAQAGRDLILSLKKEINAMLNRLIQARAAEALSAEAISKIIISLVKDYQAEGKGEAVISLSKEDRDKLEKNFLAGLKEQCKKGVTLKPSEDIRSGFTISFDAGKSQFDFTDQALAGYIGAYLKPKLAEILSDPKKT